MPAIAEAHRATLALYEALFLQTGSVALAAAAAMWFARRTPALRLVIGRTSLVAVVGLVAWTFLAPGTATWKRPILTVDWYPSATEPRTSLPMRAPATPPVASDPGLDLANAPAASIDTSAPPITQSPPAPPDPRTVIDAIWMFGALVLFLHLGLGYVAVRRVRRSSRAITDDSTLTALFAAAHNAGVRVPILRSSDRVAGPVVTGVLRPTIFLPSGFAEASRPEELAAVLRHEVAHIANGDLRWTLFYRLLTIALWPQPLIRLLARPMEAACETLCDREVVESGIPAAVYADCLLRLRQDAERRRSLACGIGVVNRPRQIVTRIEAVLADRKIRTRLARPVFVLLVAAVALMSSGITGVFAPVGTRTTRTVASSWLATGIAASDARTTGVVGTWLVQSQAIRLGAVPHPFFYGSQGSAVDTFEADGSFEEELLSHGPRTPEPVANGRYVLNGTRLTIDAAGPRGFGRWHQVLAVALSGSRMAVTVSGTNVSWVYRKLRTSQLNGSLVHSGVWRSADGQLLDLMPDMRYQVADPLPGGVPGGAVKLIDQGTYAYVHGALLLCGGELPSLNSTSEHVSARVARAKGFNSSWSVRRDPRQQVPIRVAEADLSPQRTLTFDLADGFPELSRRSFRRYDSYPKVMPFDRRAARPLFGTWSYGNNYTWQFNPDGSCARMSWYGRERVQLGRYACDGHLLQIFEPAKNASGGALVFVASIDALTANSFGVGDSRHVPQLGQFSWQQSSETDASHEPVVRRIR